MDGRAVAESENLNLHMARFRNVTLEKDGAVAERLAGHRLGGGGDLRKLLRSIDAAHSDAAAAGGGLDQQWKADCLARPHPVRRCRPPRNGGCRARPARPRRRAMSRARCLSPMSRMASRLWADPDQPRARRRPRRSRHFPTEIRIPDAPPARRFRPRPRAGDRCADSSPVRAGRR